jgi:TolB-like protein/DNA-binding winged helix-turn-helix (wHTH) protein/Tfp pilus assembly protein PilF
MGTEAQHLFEFGPFRLDPAERRLLRDGRPIPLPPKNFDALLLLVEHAGHLLGKDEMTERLWPDSIVEEASLAKCIFTLRKALGDAAEGNTYIETVPRSGYRFVAEVRVLAADDDAAIPLLGIDSATPSASAVSIASAAAPRRRWMPVAAASGLLLLLVAAYLGWKSLHAAPPATAKRAMLAVLPFENLTGDPEQEFFSDGLAEELITQLGRIDPERLGVIARTSAMRYKGSQKDTKQIGTELGVAYILEGSVRREGQRVRITAQLIEVQGQSELWADNYEQESAARLPLEISVASDIATNIRQKLAPAARAAPAVIRPVDQKAYELYLRGRYFWNKRSEEGFRKAIASFEQAIAADPAYASAYAGLADCYNLLDEYSIRPSADSFPKAKAAANKALELDPTLADAHASLAYATMYYDRDWVGAEKRFRRAIELNPSDVTAHQWYGEFLVAMGRFDDATAEMKKAQQLDPFSLVVNSALAFSFHYSRQYDLAIEQYRKVIEMEPGFVVGHYGLGLAYEQKKEYERAQAEFEKAIALLGGETDAIAAIGRVQALQGKKAEARRIVGRLRSLARRKYVSPVNVAVLLLSLGENDEAFQWLEKAYQERYGWLIFLRVDPRFDGVRSDPRFNELLKRIGLAA